MSWLHVPVMYAFPSSVFVTVSDFVACLLFLSVLAWSTGQHALKLVMIVCNIIVETIGLLSSYQSSKHVIRTLFFLLKNRCDVAGIKC